MNILFVLGTKAQFIKTIPMINYAIKNKYSVTVVDLKQHPEKTISLISKINGEYSYLEFLENKKYNSDNFDTIFTKNVIINYLDNKINGEYLVV